MMLAYPLSTVDLRCTNDDYSSHSIKNSNYEYMYVTYLQHTKYPDLIHAFNNPHPPRFERSLPDAYSPSAKLIVFAHGCQIHGHFETVNGQLKGCSYLPLGTCKEDRNIYGDVYAVLEYRFEAMKRCILSRCGDRVEKVEVMFQCRFEKELRTPNTKIYNFFHGGSSLAMTSSTKHPPVMVLRDACRGGFTECFQMVAHATEEMIIEHFDINSMYPFIAIQHRFISGAGVRLMGPQMTSRLSLDYEAGCFLYFDPDTQKHIPCDIVIQVVIGLNRENDAVNRLPFLPIRLRGYKKDDLRTYRASCIQCLLKKQKQLCQHSNEQRRFRQTYTMNEVAYACSKLSYQLYAIEEAVVYCKL